jgi:hypothetical protein
MRSTSLRILALAATLAGGVAAACRESTAPKASTQVSLSFAGVKPPGAAAIRGGIMSVLADTLKQTSGSDTLKITSAQVVLRKISLKRAEASTVNCDTMPETGQNSCEEFTARAILVSLPLVAGVQTALSIPVDSGHYVGVEYKIHKPGNDSIDVAFKAANPGFDSISIKVTGLFNGVPFTYTSRMDVEQEFDFATPLVIGASGTPTNLTLRLDLTTWFVNQSTGALINPTSTNPGGANEGLVNSNIQRSAKAFEDRNGSDTENH